MDEGADVAEVNFQRALEYFRRAWLDVRTGYKEEGGEERRIYPVAWRTPGTGARDVEAAQLAIRDTSVRGLNNCPVLMTNAEEGPFHMTVWHCPVDTKTGESELVIAFNTAPGVQGDSFLPEDAKDVESSPFWPQFEYRRPYKVIKPKKDNPGGWDLALWDVKKDFKRAESGKPPKRWVLPANYMLMQDGELQLVPINQNWEWMARLWRTVNWANTLIKEGLTGGATPVFQQAEVVD